MKNGKGSKKSGSTTKNEESYEKKEDLETLFSRMLKFSEENTEKSRVDAEELAARIIEFREAAAALALDLVSNEDKPAFILGCFILSGVGGNEPARKLVELLDNEKYNSEISQLISDNIGKDAVPYLLTRNDQITKMSFEQRKPLEHTIDSILLCIGSIRNGASISYLTGLLDDYISNMPDGPFDPSVYGWKYSFFDLFHILEALVRQQNMKAIKSIEKARDSFPIEYVDHKMCQIALGRIKLKKPEGFIPLEAIEMAVPMDQHFQALEGRKSSKKDGFMEAYGEFFNPELYPYHSQLENMYSEQEEYNEYMDNDDDVEDDEF